MISLSGAGPKVHGARFYSVCLLVSWPPWDKMEVPLDFKV